MSNSYMQNLVEAMKDKDIPKFCEGIENGLKHYSDLVVKISNETPLPDYPLMIAGMEMALASIKQNCLSNSEKALVECLTVFASIPTE